MHTQPQPEADAEAEAVTVVDTTVQALSLGLAGATDGEIFAALRPVTGSTARLYAAMCALAHFACPASPGAPAQAPAEPQQAFTARFLAAHTSGEDTWPLFHQAFTATPQVLARALTGLYQLALQQLSDKRATTRSDSMLTPADGVEGSCRSCSQTRPLHVYPTRDDRLLMLCPRCWSRADQERDRTGYVDLAEALAFADDAALALLLFGAE